MLSSAQLDFAPQEILVNSTGKLLAVVGTHCLVIVILPRRGYMKQLGRSLAVKAVRVGTYYHAAHGCVPIAQCRWHPLGRDGASLVVLTEDGIVREYDVAHDVDEPQQVLNVFPGSALRSAAAFSADDDDERCAAALAFHTGAENEPSWRLCTLYALSRAGDLWAVCPFLPRHAAVPRGALVALAAAEAQRAAGAAPLPVRYLADLVRQMRDVPDADVSLDDGDESDGAAPHSTCAVDVPASVPYRTAPQGPFRLCPAPRELDEAVASVASDVAVLHVRQGAAAVDVVVIGARDGSVHVGLLAAPVSPHWAGRIAGPPAVPPTLIVHETIDLQLPAPRDELLTGNALMFATDPLYPDTVFVAHRHGVHVLLLSPWLEPLLEALASGERSAVTTAATAPLHTDVASVVRASGAAGTAGIVIMHDVYLSYSLYVLTVDAQLAAVELNLRCAPGDTSAATQAPQRDAPAYASLLDGRWAPPAALAPRARETLPRSALEMTPEALRAFGQAAASVRERMTDVIRAAHSTEAHMAQQLREGQRQVAQLRAAAARIDKLRNSEPVAVRVQRVEEAQRVTLQRLDALLQHLMDEHQPQLSVYERRWFDELGRMSAEFQGGARERLLRLEHQLGVLRPVLAERTRAAPPAESPLGTRQREHVEAALSDEARLLAQARAKVQRLQQSLARLA